MKEYFYLKKKDKEKLLTQITSILKRKTEVIFAYCYGTFLLEKIKFRDIDIALYLKETSSFFKKGETFEYEQKMADILEKEIKYPVDVKVLNVAPVYFLNNVFRTGKLLFSRNDKLLVKLIEESSLEAMANYNFSLNSLYDLVS